MVTRAYWSASTFVKSRGQHRMPYRPIEEILAIQAKKLKRMVAHAYGTVPHYREAMQEKGLTPGDFSTAGDLGKLPRISGKDLSEQPARFYSEKYPSSQTLTLLSSGTSGKPKAVSYNAAALFESLAHGHRQRAVLRHFTGRLSAYREMNLVRNYSISHQLRNYYETQAWVPKKMDLERRVLTLDLPFQEMVQGINEFRPHVLTGYGSHLGALMRWVHTHGKELHRPKAIWYGADTMPEADRSLIEEELGIPVISTYQADESLRIGFQCEQRNGFHLHVDHVAVQVIRADGKPAGPGEEGKIIISNLTNRATVLLNYALGDIVTMPTKPCSCGRTLPTISRVTGRADDLILLPDGQSRHSLLFMAPMQRVQGVVQVQLVQESRNTLIIRSVCSPDCNWELVKSRLEQLAQDGLSTDMAVCAERVKEIPREASGKTRAVISRCRNKHA